MVKKWSKKKKTQCKSLITLGRNKSMNARSENRTRTGFPTRPSNVRVYQFRHPSLPSKLAIWASIQDPIRAGHPNLNDLIRA